MAVPEGSAAKSRETRGIANARSQRSRRRRGPNRPSDPEDRKGGGGDARRTRRTPPPGARRSRRRADDDDAAGSCPPRHCRGPGRLRRRRAGAGARRPRLPERGARRVPRLLRADLGTPPVDHPRRGRKPRVPHAARGTVLGLFLRGERRAVQGLLQLRDRSVARGGAEQQLRRGLRRAELRPGRLRWLR